MIRRRVRFTTEARDQLRSAVRWWQRRRLASPWLLVDEVRAAVKLLARAPGAGIPVVSAVLPGLCRVTLRGSRFHPYYVPAGDDVSVVAIWSAVRGRGPPIVEP